MYLFIFILKYSDDNIKYTRNYSNFYIRNTSAFDIALMLKKFFFKKYFVITSVATTSVHNIISPKTTLKNIFLCF